MKQIVSGYGTWKSPLTAARVTAGALRFDHLVVDGEDLYWAEGRASEGGRAVIVRRTRDGHVTDLTPAEFNVRTRVHEYGGAAYTVHNGTLFFSNFADQRVYRQDPGGTPRAITRPGCFYAEPFVDRARARLLYVREDHRSGDVINDIVAISFDGTRELVIAAGADFYSDPIVSPDGAHVAWLQWNHPNMPWDGTELYVATFDQSGAAHDVRLVAGGVNESIFQPAWSPEGELFYVSDRSGWWNLYRGGPPSPWQPTSAHSGCVLVMEAEFGKPQWMFSQTTYCFIDERRIAATYTQQGQWRLGILDIGTGAFAPVNMSLEPLEGIRAIGGTLYFIGGSPTEPQCIAAITTPAREPAVGEPHGLDAAIIRSATSDRIPTEWVSVAQPITYRSEGREVHAFYYAPHSPEFIAPDGERPPLIVVSHGGPTATSFDILDARVQFWTSRGFAILDVNYSGSTGFGRAYRERLHGNWGIADVADCVNGARHLVQQGQADPDRLAIRGGSAGGYTTLAALTFYDTFKAGASHYGVSDVELLAQDTHKFESRYLDSLIGPYPAARDRYRARSPIHFTDRLSAALILFQGLEDKVVPPNQAEIMAEAVRRKDLPVAYVAFEGEQHGFRKAENIIRSLEAELYFYGVVFGFTPADPIEPVAIANAKMKA